MNDNHHPQGLILGPGGIKGLLELGALSFLERVNLLNLIDTVVGVSVGAIIGFLLSIEYTSDQIIEEALQLKLFDNLLSFNLHRLRDILIKRGLVDPRQIQDVLDRLVIDKYGYVPNLQDLYMLTGVNFVCVALNLTRGRPEFFDYLRHPTILCTEAIMLSCNIPGFFQPVFYQGDRYVDGAFANPYPVDYFSNYPDLDNYLVLGIYIDLPELIPPSDQSRNLNQPLSSPSGNSSHSNSSQQTVSRIPPSFNNLKSVHEKALNELVGPLDSPFVELYRSVNTTMFLMRDLIIKNQSNVRCLHFLLSGHQLDPLGLAISTPEKIKMIDSGWIQAERLYSSLYADQPPYLVIRYYSPDRLVDSDKSDMQPQTSRNHVQSRSPNRHDLKSNITHNPIELHPQSLHQNHTHDVQDHIQNHSQNHFQNHSQGCSSSKGSSINHNLVEMTLSELLRLIVYW